MRLRQDFNQRNLKRGEWQGAIEAITAAFPLSGHTGATIEEGCYQISFVAIDVGDIFGAREITKHAFRECGVSIRREGMAQRGWSDRHVQHPQPPSPGGGGFM